MRSFVIKQSRENCYPGFEEIPRKYRNNGNMVEKITGGGGLEMEIRRRDWAEQETGMEVGGSRRK
jgi:hypothetical protein